MTAQFVSGCLMLAACVLLACRIDKMSKGITKTSVFWQHFLLGISLFVAWVIGFTQWYEWAPAVMSGGVLQFFLFSIDRWRRGAPEGTTKPIPLDQLHHISGGKK